MRSVQKKGNPQTQERYFRSTEIRGRLRSVNVHGRLQAVQTGYPWTGGDDFKTDEVGQGGVQNVSFGLTSLMDDPGAKKIHRHLVQLKGFKDD